MKEGRLTEIALLLYWYFLLLFRTNCSYWCFLLTIVLSAPVFLTYSFPAELVLAVLTFLTELAFHTEIAY